jgi:hypothetical protein
LLYLLAPFIQLGGGANYVLELPAIAISTGTWVFESFLDAGTASLVWCNYFVVLILQGYGANDAIFLEEKKWFSPNQTKSPGICCTMFCLVINDQEQFISLKNNFSI